MSGRFRIRAARSVPADEGHRPVEQPVVADLPHWRPDWDDTQIPPDPRARATELQARLDAHRELLTRALARPVAPLDFDTFKQSRPGMPDIDESVLITPAEPLPKPPGVHERLPPKPGLRGLLPTVRRQYNQRVHAAMRAAEADFARYREEEARRKENAEQAGKLRIAQAAWDSVSEQHAEIDRYALAVRGGDPYSVCRYFHQKISAVVADDPPELITHFQPGYEPDNRVLKLRYELPEPAVVPTHDVVTAEGMTPVFQSLPAEEHEHLYLELICRIALRALRTAFGTDPADLVETVLFNGVVSTVEETELVPEQVCVLSVAVTAVRFAEIDLASVNPVAAVETDFAGNLTSNVATLSPVPLVRLNGSLIRTTPVDRVVPEPS